MRGRMADDEKSALYLHAEPPLCLLWGNRSWGRAPFQKHI